MKRIIIEIPDMVFELLKKNGITDVKVQKEAIADAAYEWIYQEISGDDDTWFRRLKVYNDYETKK